MYDFLSYFLGPIRNIEESRVERKENTNQLRMAYGSMGLVLDGIWNIVVSSQITELSNTEPHRQKDLLSLNSFAYIKREVSGLFCLQLLFNTPNLKGKTEQATGSEPLADNNLITLFLLYLFLWLPSIYGKWTGFHS